MDDYMYCHTHIYKDKSNNTIILSKSVFDINLQGSLCFYSLRVAHTFKTTKQTISYYFKIFLRYEFTREFIPRAYSKN